MCDSTFNVPIINRIKSFSHFHHLFFETTNGRRALGPPKSFSGEQPGLGCEVFVGRLSANVFEDDLYKCFSRVGNVYQVKIMLNSESEHKGYAFVRFMEKEGAYNAVRYINKIKIPPGEKHVFVAPSTDNRTLEITGVLYTVTDKQIKHDLEEFVTGEPTTLSSFKIELQQHPFAYLVTFTDHRSALLAEKHFKKQAKRLWGPDAWISWKHSDLVQQLLKEKREYWMNRAVRQPTSLPSDTSSSTHSSSETLSQEHSRLNSPPSTLGGKETTLTSLAAPTFSNSTFWNTRNPLNNLHSSNLPFNMQPEHSNLECSPWLTHRNPNDGWVDSEVSSLPFSHTTEETSNSFDLQHNIMPSTTRASQHRSTQPGREFLNNRNPNDCWVNSEGFSLPPSHTAEEPLNSFDLYQHNMMPSTASASLHHGPEQLSYTSTEPSREFLNNNSCWFQEQQSSELLSSFVPDKPFTDTSPSPSNKQSYSSAFTYGLKTLL